MRQAVAIPLSLIFAGLAACSQTLETGTRPTREAIAQFRVPVEHMKLDNGLRVVISADRDMERVHVGSWFGAGLGSANRGPTPRGLVAARMLTLSGDSRPPVVESDLTGFINTAPPAGLQALLAVEARRMARANDFHAEEFRKARHQTANAPDSPVAPISPVPLRWPRLMKLSGAETAPALDRSLANLTPDGMRRWLSDWYHPGNAALLVVGPVSTGETFSKARELFGGLPGGERSPAATRARPDQLREERYIGHSGDAAGGVTLAYRMPERHTDAWYAMGLLAAVVRNDLSKGDDSLVVDTGMHLLGNPFAGRSPAFWYVHVRPEPHASTESLVERVQATIERLRTRPISHARLQSAIDSARRLFYPLNAGLGPEGRMKLLAAFTLLDGDPTRINALDRRFRNVTPQSILGAAQRYLRPTNCTILAAQPETEPAAGAENRLPIR